MEKLLEICVDSVESAVAAKEGGADRLELCGDLLVGGVSPSPYLIEAVLRLDIPTNVLLRPRFGDFLYTGYEKEILYKEVEHCRSLGVSGVVVGALTAEGDLDVPFLTELLKAAGPLRKTLHRAFDVARDPFEALENSVTIGFDTILTSGQAATAMEGLSLLKELHEAAGDRLTIMAGSGVSSRNLPTIFEKTGITAFHMSAKMRVESPMVFRRSGVPMGLPMASEYDRFYTNSKEVTAAKKAFSLIF